MNDIFIQMSKLLYDKNFSELKWYERRLIEAINDIIYKRTNTSLKSTYRLEVTTCDLILIDRFDDKLKALQIADSYRPIAKSVEVKEICDNSFKVARAIKTIAMNDVITIELSLLNNKCFFVEFNIKIDPATLPISVVSGLYDNNAPFKVGSLFGK